MTPFEKNRKERDRRDTLITKSGSPTVAHYRAMIYRLLNIQNTETCEFSKCTMPDPRNVVGRQIPIKEDRLKGCSALPHT